MVTGGARETWEGARVDTNNLATTFSSPKFNFHVEDIEEEEELARMEGWDLRLVQLSAGKFSSRYSGIEIPGGYLSLEAIGRSTLHFSGSPPKGHTSIILPLKIGKAFQYRNRIVREADAIIVRQGQEAEFVIEDGLHFAAIYLTEEFNRTVRREVIGPIAAAQDLGLPSIMSGPRVAAIKRRISDLFCLEAAEPMSQVSVSGLRQAAEEIALQLLTAVWQQPAITPEPPAQGADNKQSLASHARDIMEANGHRSLKLSDLSGRLGVSIRTLQYGFKDRYGISPAKYHSLLRLNGAYADLKRSDPSETSVTKVATSWGFYHFGRFSKTFQAQFGELPSQTLARKRARLLWHRKGQPLRSRWRPAGARTLRSEPSRPVPAGA